MESKPKQEHEYDAAICKGDEANMILKNETLKSVLGTIEQAAIGRLLDQEDAELRSEAWHQVRAVRALKAELQRIVDNGKVASSRKARK